MSKLRESKFVSMVATGVVAALGVAVITFAATTISSNVNTGGTLTVSGASTLNGAVTLGDAIGDNIVITGNATTSNSLYVTSALTVGGYSTTTSTGALILGSGLGLGASNSVAKTILFSPLTSDPTAAAGLVYYDSGSSVLRMSDGTNWFTVGTSTSGLTLSGNRLQLASLNYYLTAGTTTQQGLSMLTLESTSTVGIPLTIVGYNGQTANLLQLRNVASANVLTVNAAGGIFSSSTLTVAGLSTLVGFQSSASSSVAGTLTVSSAFNSSSTINVDGATTLNGNVTLGNAAADVITLTGNASTTNALTVGGNLYANGFATTTGSSGQFATQGFIGAGGTSTPAAELSASGTATTTVYAHSSTSLKGACLEVKGTDNVVYRMYVTGSDTSTTTTNGRTAIVALWEAGACK
ncbi:MAG: hypothetical protein AAB795_00210 [Patescibacteria group bacterium]